MAPNPELSRVFLPALGVMLGLDALAFLAWTATGNTFGLLLGAAGSMAAALVVALVLHRRQRAGGAR